MRKRLELALPLYLTDDRSALPSDGQVVTGAARELVELFLSDGEIAQACPYLRATGDSARVADAIETVEAGDGVKPLRLEDLSTEDLERLLAEPAADAPPTEPPVMQWSRPSDRQTNHPV